MEAILARVKAHRGLWARQGLLKGVDGRAEVLRLEVGEAADGTGGLVDDHVLLVTEARDEEVVSTTHDGAAILDGTAGGTALGNLIQQELGRVTDEAGDGQRGAEGVLLAELLDELGDGQTVGALDLVHELDGMELNHLVGTGGGLLRLADPTADDDGVLGGGVEEVGGTDEGGGRDHAGRVDDGLLHVAFDGTQHGGIDDAGQDAEGVGTVQIDVAGHVLGEGGGDNDDIVGVAGLGNLLDEQIDHTAEAGIVGHEQLGDAEEDCWG